MSHLNIAAAKNIEDISSTLNKQECSQVSKNKLGITELSDHQLESFSGGTKWVYKYRRNGQLKKVVIKD
ncbi:MAG: hypothetical protein ACFCAD_07245 [Pleurocapsa sp.]